MLSKDFRRALELSILAGQLPQNTNTCFRKPQIDHYMRIVFPDIPSEDGQRALDDEFLKERVAGMLSNLVGEACSITNMEGTSPRTNKRVLKEP